MEKKLPVASCQLPENTGGDSARGLHWQLTTNNWQLSSAFTLTELLVVISIIVLMLGLAVPVLKILGGSKSIESTENQIAAILGRARAQAIADRTVAGVMFFLDPKDSRVKAAIVEESPSAVALPAGVASGSISLDLATDSLATDNGLGGNASSDIFLLPSGIGVQFIHNCTVDDTKNPPARQGDGYIGFNSYNSYNGPAGAAPGQSTIGGPVNPAMAGVEYGGVILFDATGKLLSVHYLFHTADPLAGGVLVVNAPGAAGGSSYTKLGQLLFGTAQYDTTPVANMDFVSPSPTVDAQYGLVVFDHDAFLSLGYSDQDQVVEGIVGYNNYIGATWTDQITHVAHQSELQEENWLDSNSTPLIIDRYDGSLIRGE